MCGWYTSLGCGKNEGAKKKRKRDQEQVDAAKQHAEKTRGLTWRLLLSKAEGAWYVGMKRWSLGA